MINKLNIFCNIPTYEKQLTNGDLICKRGRHFFFHFFKMCGMSCITTTDVNKVYATFGSFITNDFILCAQVLYDLCTNLVAFL